MSENIGDVLLALGARDYEPGDRVEVYAVLYLGGGLFVWQRGTVTTIGGQLLRVHVDGGRTVTCTRNDVRPLEAG